MEKVLRLPDVISTVGLSRSSLYTMIQSGHFPPPIKLSSRASGWLESDIQRWIEEKKGGTPSSNNKCIQEDGEKS